MRIRPLAEVSPPVLRPVLDEEGRHWRDDLAWDTADVASAVLDGLEEGQVHGWAALDAGRMAAYACYMDAEGRTVLGSVFASARYRETGLEERLLELVLPEACRSAKSRRVEAQTLFCTSRGVDDVFRRWRFRSGVRHYMTLDLGRPAARPAPGPALRRVRKDDLDELARLVHGSHVATPDADLNLTYASPTHCRSFLESLLLRDAFGPFDTEASAVVDGPHGLTAAILATRLSATNGHVCQVSVHPHAQGRGLGTHLLGAATAAMARQGLRQASLAVTAANTGALLLYTRMGFTPQRNFGAHAWVRDVARAGAA